MFLHAFRRLGAPSLSTTFQKQLRQALQKNAATPTGHYYVALALMKQHEFEAAEEEFQLSIRNSNDRIAPAHEFLAGSTGATAVQSMN
jgi:hypothetical protein